MGAHDDDNTGWVLALLLGLITLVVAFVIGLAVLRSPGKPAPAPVPEVTAAADSGPSIDVEDGQVTFFFAPGQATLAAGTQEALAGVVKAVAAGKKVTLSGFHDATGDPDKNLELAQQRAMAVRDALAALGVADDKVALKKPAHTLATGTDKQARRVEVTVH